MICIGRTKTLGRCKVKVNKWYWPFCGFHKWQLIGLLAVTIPTFIVLYTDLYNVFNSKEDFSKTHVDSLAKIIKKGDLLILEKIDSSQQKLQKNQETAKAKQEDSTKKIIDRIDNANEKQNKNQEEILTRLEEIKNPPREPNGLYRDNKKWGVVKSFNIKDDGITFTIDKIEFDNPIRDMNEIWIPFEYQEYIIKFQKIESLVTMFPPSAESLEGVILKENK